jgi:hypothetical protein
MKILPSQECACHFLCDDTFEYHVVRIVTIWPRSLGANDVLRHIPDEAHRSSPGIMVCGQRSGGQWFLRRGPQHMSRLTVVARLT